MRETSLRRGFSASLSRPHALCGTTVALAALLASAAPASAGAVGEATAAPVPAPTAQPVCPGRDLDMSWDTSGAAKEGRPSGQQETAVVRVTNQGNRPCVLTGHPEVTLRAAGRDTESLRADGRAEAPLTLGPGRAASFEVVFLSETAEPAQAITPVRMSVRLPGTGAEATLPWRWGPVTRQEAATHPGNHVGPLTAVTSTAHPTGHRPASPRPVGCGQGWHGLQVVAVSRHGADACPTATAVTAALGRALDAGRDLPVTVRAAGTAWKCAEREGDPNPHLECVNTRGRSERALLVS
ncbi:DUF4232 domain-containing protein [Streptomyces sp. NPDC051211]|uniref:DUF4232 domain-containing protein n=1 Tax=Streptomyces sp. NPDC051211 TaxID=3154643 RepID=UPI00344E1290